ncbi:transferase-domain-containing protein [Cylindrobasidium torrendii FP15055 ss-10]|uniref:Transferase-domain-containing protein n=1 Tax=Cylindrobasidium torrendii FP15055 ss-10 TaxID=1314674 RepID=A0A0D7B9T9_9AGAR|nr:transferase-domain-containing protein [Cylindrobasidium torrendii FP15055 ss-10]
MTWSDSVASNQDIHKQAFLKSKYPKKAETYKAWFIIMSESSSIVTVSSERLHPRQSSRAKSIPLSILDSKVLNFSCTAGLWAFSSLLDPARLKKSLLATLSAGYSQWAGRLRLTNKGAPGHFPAHSARFARVYLDIPGDGSEDGPGVAFVVSSSEGSLVSRFRDRPSGAKVWDAGDITHIDGLFPADIPLALSNLQEDDKSPAVIIQVTTFSCGGTVVAVKMAHVLGDAQTLATFLTDWSSTHRRMANNEASELVAPLFDPSLLDQRATPNIDSDVPDESSLARARRLPMSRNDWWAAPASGTTPSWATTIATIPPHLKSEHIQQETPMAWSEWDLGVPVKDTRILLTADDIDKIWNACSEGLDSQDVRISKFDAIQAFIWTILLRARRAQLADAGDDTAVLNITLGARERIKPPLPSRFLGSPIFLARVEAYLAADGSLKDSMGDLAASIRRTVQLFDDAAVGNVLHEMAHEVCPYRTWGAFLGRRTSIVTSWVRLKVYDVDFGVGRPVAVEAVMPSMDGCIHVMEAKPTFSPGPRWYEDGIIVSVSLREDVAKRLSEDPLLKGP